MALTKSERKERLQRARGIQQNVALKLGLSKSTVSLVANNKTQLLSKHTVRDVRAAIAEELGETVEEFWGTAA
jgi:hypothetical protein